MVELFETNATFLVKYNTTGKASFLFLMSISLVLTKFLFWDEDWSLGYNSMTFYTFSDIA